MRQVKYRLFLMFIVSTLNKENIYILFFNYLQLLMRFTLV